MLWLLLALLVTLLSFAIFAVTAISLWRAVKALGRQVSAAGETVEQLTGSLDGARATGGPAPGAPGTGALDAGALDAGGRDAGACPTCGAPPRDVARRPSGVPAPAR